MPIGVPPPAARAASFEGEEARLSLFAVPTSLESRRPSVRTRPRMQVGTPRRSMPIFLICSPAAIWSGSTWSAVKRMRSPWMACATSSETSGSSSSGTLGSTCGGSMPTKESRQSSGPGLPMRMLSPHAFLKGAEVWNTGCRTPKRPKEIWTPTSNSSSMNRGVSLSARNVSSVGSCVSMRMRTCPAPCSGSCEPGITSRSPKWFSCPPGRRR
mmetsp:Transcript_28789/g.72923  ORF Transcript_28789/g.72923 Transcript_28789/m.72923 type:complete len:213 (-) Transcript_28789:322-960(-)